ncbi:hypothetical protein DPMN_029845 [Dreissena polymorpha]|uniref:Uncharacterized protein n=1 Tax=Dreissena polymorpha TaxID=45954 RepID=A0A9D4RFN8_DREPO|nr:hypothetical protein DPMN_029845 [Dreissena polymorpha]
MSLTHNIVGSELTLEWVDGLPGYSPIYGHLIQVNSTGEYALNVCVCGSHLSD